MSIREFRPGDRVEGFFLLSGAYSKQSANGKPFLSVELGDASGTIEGKVWDYSGPVSPADTGAVVKIRGMVSEFRGAPQVTVEQIRLAVPGDVYNVKTLVPTAHWTRTMPAGSCWPWWAPSPMTTIAGCVRRYWSTMGSASLPSPRPRRSTTAFSTAF